MKLDTDRDMIRLESVFGYSKMSQKFPVSLHAHVFGNQESWMAINWYSSLRVVNRMSNLKFEILPIVQTECEI